MADDPFVQGNPLNRRDNPAQQPAALPPPQVQNAPPPNAPPPENPARQRAVGNAHHGRVNDPRMKNLQDILDVVGKLPGDKPGKGPLSWAKGILNSPSRAAGGFIGLAGAGSLLGGAANLMRGVGQATTTGALSAAGQHVASPTIQASNVSHPAGSTTQQTPAPIQARSFATPIAGSGGVGMGFGPNLVGGGMGLAAIVVALQRMTDVFTSTVSAAANRPLVMPEGGQQVHWSK